MKPKEEYKVVHFVDVNELLDFAKQEYHALDEKIKEERRIETRLRDFIENIQKKSGSKIHHIGSEKREGKLLVRYLLKGGGFLEVIAEKPLSMNAHFMNEKQAVKFAEGLKRTLKHTLPESTIKSLVIDSIQVQDGHKDQLTFETWRSMHKVAIQNTLVVTVLTVLIFTFLHFVKEIVSIFAEEFVHSNSVGVSIFLALVIAIFLEPVKNRIEKIVLRFIK